MTLDRILVVCVGNICRSPMAAAMIAQQYPQKRIDSAGIAALIGAPADQHAIAIMAAQGIDITDHTAKQISENLVRDADLILTMTVSQSDWIKSQWSHCRGKVFRLGHWQDQEIDDPYQQDPLAFEIAYQDIKNSLPSWVDKFS